ncbi:MAG: CRISPR-associated RAMP protein [Thermogemmatispora sp.]|uniref:type III CRISPR-associated RAMP protein Csx7 n=1 Tax=Thermogemmatispora sp. TaxID=1968838 RepID=UPI00261C2C4C|nr:CRISPR-associated RAMP protein Csx7 [Thermogemmatispora sp.]MBX5459024.1 CRISPR-associated RAMP protein [Thermogemmatispora sp.]
MAVQDKLYQDDPVRRLRLCNRYLFTGRLVMETALHIGGGKLTLSGSRNPIVLTPENIPFIPGSSFKGALRSTVEKLVATLAELPQPRLSTCGLIELESKQLEQLEQEGRLDDICPTVRQRTITEERRQQGELALGDILGKLCHTCRLFGSPFSASRVNVSDLYIPEEEWNGIIQLRDGVAIERDSERAKDRLKYDYEVVPASTSFNLEITLENATDEDRWLLSLGLSEFVNGFGAIGGKRSRGLGACRLRDLRVYILELEKEETADGGQREVSAGERTRRLQRYLLGRSPEEKFHRVEDGESFLARQIEQLFQAN